MSQIEGLETYNRESNQMNQMFKSYCCKIFQQQGIGTQAIQQQCLGTQATGLIPKFQEYIQRVQQGNNNGFKKWETDTYATRARRNMEVSSEMQLNTHLEKINNMEDIICQQAQTIVQMQQNNIDLMRQLQGAINNKKGDEKMEIKEESSIEIEYNSGQNKNKSEIKSINGIKNMGSMQTNE
ncbi:hypothetical protein GJ496_002528 [Pomphorhynchus laevis]|nr:hypothetical protein GJ496_002528 [Pomphorhynchus laevis]